MPDELYAQYRKMSHQELYDRLGTGDPAQVDALVTTWKAIETTASGLAASLKADLDRLMQHWDSVAGWEFHYRVSLIAAYAQMLAEEFASIHTGLSAMSGALADAKGEAEPPEAVPPPPTSTTAGDVATALLGGASTVVTGVIGNNLGHQPDPAAQRRAHERMVNVVADLAGEYRVAEYGTWPPSVPTAPPEMPSRHTPPPPPPVAPQTQPTSVKAQHGISFGQGGHDRGRDDRRDHRRGHDGQGSSFSSQVGPPRPTTAPAVIGAAVVGVGATTSPSTEGGVGHPVVRGEAIAEMVVGTSEGVTGVGEHVVVTDGVIGGTGESTAGAPDGTPGGGTPSGDGTPGGGTHGEGGGHGGTSHSAGDHGGGVVGGGGDGDHHGQPATMPPPTTATPTQLAAAAPTSAAHPMRPDTGLMSTPVVEEQRRWLTSGNVAWRGDEDTSSPAVLGPPELDEQYDQ
jgi:hypothetical protein